MSPISKRAYQLELFKLRILEVQKVIDGTIGNHSPTPLVIAMKAQVILIKNYIDEIKNMWSAYLTLASDTNIFITNTHLEISTESVNSYIASMLLIANNIPIINNSTTTRVLDLLKLISGVINGRFDGYSNIVKSLNSLIQIVEEIDNPPISRSRSSRSSSRSSRSSHSSRSSRSSPIPPPSIPTPLPSIPTPLSSSPIPLPSIPIPPPSSPIPPPLGRQDNSMTQRPAPLERQNVMRLSHGQGKKFLKKRRLTHRKRGTRRNNVKLQKPNKHYKTKKAKNII